MSIGGASGSLNSIGSLGSPTPLSPTQGSIEREIPRSPGLDNIRFLQHSFDQFRVEDDMSVS